VTEIGRSALAKIFGTKEYKAAAAKPGNVTDATKVRREFGPPAERRPTCANPYFAGFQTLCRENPPPGVPIPPSPPASDVAAVFRRDAVMVAGGLSNFNSEPRDEALRLGWTVVEVQLLHTGYAEANETEMGLSQWAAFTKVGWGTYGQDSDPHQDGKDAAAISRRLSLAAWKANGELWAEAAGIAKTNEFIRGWVEGGAPCPLGWSVLSSDTANFPRPFDYGAALGVAGADIDIQVYGASYPLYTVAAGLGMLQKARVPVSRTTMTFDCNGDGNGPFADYRTWTGPRRLYNQGDATVDTFRALVRP
jgi:hypothetical protein